MRGIYLVANNQSEALCANLIYSIRAARCRLPIRLIPFGGRPVRSRLVLDEVEVFQIKDFPEAGRQFVGAISGVLPNCPRGLLNRILAWFGDWDEFIYSDNDIVALMNWESLFDFLPGYNLVHADEEYATGGKYDYEQPDMIANCFGINAFQSAMTSGFFLARRDLKLLVDMEKAVEWIQKHPTILKHHDQSFLNVASLVGKWKTLNLCKPPHHWLSSWAGDYENPLALILAMQANAAKQISHLHFSGGMPNGVDPITDFLSANLNARQRMVHLTKLGALELGGWHYSRRIKNGLRRRLKKIF